VAGILRGRRRFVNRGRGLGAVAGPAGFLEALAMDFVARLSVLQAVVERGSISAAAAGLGVSVSTASRALGALEDDLGVQLVARTTRRMKLTDAGTRLYDRARRIALELEQARAELSGPRGVTGRLVVSVSVTLGLQRLLPSLPELARRHPGLQLDVRLEEHPVDLIASGVDVVIRAGRAPAARNSLVARRLITSASWLVAASGYLHRRGAPARPDDLAGHDALVHLTQAGSSDRWTLKQGGRPITVQVRGPLRSTTLLALHAAAIGGMGIASLPVWLVHADVASGGLVRVLADCEPPTIQVHAIYRDDLRSDARVAAFLSHARAALELPATG
jgi:DNA-binding transcriptional LysR family regulator